MLAVVVEAQTQDKPLVLARLVVEMAELALVLVEMLRLIQVLAVAVVEVVRQRVVTVDQVLLFCLGQTVLLHTTQ
jgi:hypothetical protein